MADYKGGGGGGGPVVGGKTAATFVVSTDPSEGDYTTIQDAIDNLPAEGGYILVREGTYPISATILIPADKPVIIRGCGSGTVVDMESNVIAAFTMENGIVGVLQPIVGDLQILGDGTAGQVAFRNLEDGTTGRANFLVNMVVMSAVELIMDFAAYDENFTSTTTFRFTQCIVKDLFDGILAQAPEPAGSFFGLANLYFINCDLGPARFVDFDGDLYIEGSISVFFASDQDNAVDNLYLKCQDFNLGQSLAIYGPGNLPNLAIIEGALITGGILTTFWTIIFTDCLVTNTRVVIETNAESSAFIGCVAFTPLEINANLCIVDRCKCGSGVDDAVTLADVQLCKIHDSEFAVTAPGNAVIETGTSDNNIFHDNTNFSPVTIIGAGSIQHDNIA